MEARGQTPGLGSALSPVGSKEPAQVLKARALPSLTGPEAKPDRYVLQIKRPNRSLL